MSTNMESGAFNGANWRAGVPPALDDLPQTARADEATSIQGTFLGMKYQIRAMLRGGGGTIVNMASRAGVSTPMRRVGSVYEVADVVLWLCSKQSSYVTGAVIPGRRWHVSEGQAAVDDAGNW
jgi:NAD(P)-dependent dehydrogenase (short-subunit alcohol dehydrogenase family)